MKWIVSRGFSVPSMTRHCRITPRYLSKWASKTNAFSGASGSPWGRGSFSTMPAKHVFNADAGLCGNGNRRERIEPQIRIDLLAHPVNVGGRQIDLIDHRQQFQIVFQGQIEVGNRLRFDPLRRIDDDQRTFARHQRTPHFVRKINVARRIDQIQQIVLAVRGTVGERDRIALDRDPPFALDIHRVEHLVVELALRNATTSLDQPIGQSRLAMIDMGDDAKVPNMFHTSRSCGKCADTSLTDRILVNGASDQQGFG